MFVDRLLNWLHYSLIFLTGMLVMHLLEPSIEDVKLEYSSLDTYYLDCMSWHDGTGDVIINTQGEVVSLTCADGHAPEVPRHRIKTSHLVRSN